MYCTSCGNRNEDAARFCDRCGADLSAMPRPTVPPGVPPPSLPIPPAPAPAGPPTVYPASRQRAWWYPIGVWAILSAFFLFSDLLANGRVIWAYWPIGILGIFMIGFPLLRRLEAWALARNPPRP